MPSSTTVDSKEEKEGAQLKSRSTRRDKPAEDASQPKNALSTRQPPPESRLQRVTRPHHTASYQPSSQTIVTSHPIHPTVKQTEAHAAATPNTLAEALARRQQAREAGVEAAPSIQTQKTKLLSSLPKHGGGYEEFLQVLRNEVASDHTELWTSFRSVFSRNAPVHVSERPKRVKFDPKTKKMLVEMNLHLKRASPMECVTEAQLVNDKKLTKKEKEEMPEIRQSIADRVRKLSERQNGAAAAAAASPKVGKRNLPTTTRSNETSNNGTTTELVQKKKGDAAWRKPPVRATNQSTEEPPAAKGPLSTDATGQSSVPTVSKTIELDDDEPLNSSRYKRPKSWLQIKKDRQLSKQKSLLDSSVDAAAEKDTSELVESKGPHVVSKRKERLSDAVPEDVRSVFLVCDQADSDPLSAGVKLKSAPLIKQNTIKSTRDIGVSGSKEEGSVAPWSKVKLRHVATPTKVAGKEPSNDNKTAPVFRGQLLRKVPSEVMRTKKENPPAPLPSQSTDTNVPVLSTVPRAAAVQVTHHNKVADPMAKSGEGVLDADSSSLTETPPLASDSFPLPEIQETISNLSSSSDLDFPVPDVFGLQVGNDIDLSSLPVEAFDSQKDAAIVEIQRNPGMPESHRVEVVIGKRALLMTRSVEGEQMSQITWCVPRSDVNSMTLDMAENRADLLMSNGSSKSLVFGSVEACLLFAGVFYQTNTVVPSSFAAKNEVENDKPQVQNVVDQQLDGDNLNEEEQKLLETYRQMRKTKDPDAALRETMAVESSHLGLTEEEEKAAESYRKMLRLKIPAEAVRHKMTKDGVSEKVVSAVLDSPQKPQDSAPSDKKSNLSKDEEKIAATYRKMLKLRIPPDAVRHKMTSDQIDSKIMKAVLDDAPPEASSENGASSTEVKHSRRSPTKASILSEEEEKVALAYRKMLKMMIPADAVRHKMKRDNVDGKIVIAVLGPDSSDSASSANSDATLTTEEEAVASQYRKMLKMMIPKDAVHHKMKKDQVDPKITMVVLGLGSIEPKPKERSDSELSIAEEGIAQKYRLMLKRGLPKDAVRHKMTGDEISQKIINAVLGDEKSTVEPGQSRKRATKRGSQLVSLHWTPLSGEELNNSIWKNASKQKIAAHQPESGDISKLVELFQKKTNNRLGAVGESSASNSDGKAKLVELNRANNIAISLKAFKDFSYKELAETIAHLDPLRKIRGERVQFIKDLLPTASEVKTIKAYKGDDSKLVQAELFFKELVVVPRIQTKVLVMQTMDTFKDTVVNLQQNFTILAQVCHQIMTSVKLQEVLEMVLHVGNIMNEGTRTGGAAGFKFDSLLKLTQTKSADGKTTVLDYLVMIFVAKEKEETLDLFSDFPECQTASRMMISDMMGEVRQLGSALKQCSTELESLKAESGNEETPATTTEKTMDPKAALFAAIQKRSNGDSNDGEPPAKKAFSHRAAFLAAIESKAQPTEDTKESTVGKLVNPFTQCTTFDNTVSPDEGEGGDEEEDDFEDVKSDAATPDREDSLEGGIERLEEFKADASAVLEKLEKDRHTAIDACKALSRYCGEGGGERATSSVLCVLAEFATNLDNAVKKHRVRVEAEARREAAALKRKEHQRRPAIKVNSISTKSSLAQQAALSVVVESPTKTASSQETKELPTPTAGQSLVLMVNQLLKEVPNEVKDDFKQGLVYNNPDDKLRAIYKKERQSLGFSSPAAGRPTQVDLLAAIKKRQEPARNEGK